jgi:hypothetical protein
MFGRPPPTPPPRREHDLMLHFSFVFVCIHPSSLFLECAPMSFHNELHIYTVLAIGCILMIACLCGMLGLHKRSVAWMNWCNRFVSLVNEFMKAGITHWNSLTFPSFLQVCLVEFLAWILLLIFGIPSATSKTFHKL